MSDLEVFDLMRVPISLPCVTPVVPATGDCKAPIEQRTEKCARDAWWIFELAPTCHMHMYAIAEIFGFDLDGLVAERGYPINRTERLAWGEAHRYPQDEARFLGQERATS